MSTQFNLSDLPNLVDVEGFYERHGVVIAGKATNSREGKEVHGSCPRCFGHDRFIFWPDTGRFSCSTRSSGCGWHGQNMYYFLKDQGYNHWDALKELGVDASEIGFNGGQKVKLPLFLLTEEEPCKEWQEAAAGFSRACEHVLWSSKGKAALDYLHGRGIKDETIKQARLGLCPEWHKAAWEDWGLTQEQLERGDGSQLAIPKGITLPWRVDNNVWKIQLRRPEGGYFQVKGSCDCLYNSDTLQVGQPVCLFESELDALSAQQEGADLAAMLATGGTSKGVNARNVARLARASIILQCFDQDEPGQRGAEAWLAKYAKEKARRWAPWSHDCNDMLKTGLPVRSWIEAGLQTFQTTVKTTPPAQPILTPEEQAQRLLQEFEAENGELYIRDDGQLVYLVPEYWSDARYEEWANRLNPFGELLYRIIEQREVKGKVAA